MQFIKTKASIEKINMSKSGKRSPVRHDSVHITKSNRMMEEYLERVMNGEIQLSKSLKRKAAKVRKRKKIDY